MSGNAEYRGLCSTCKHAPTCTFPRDPQGVAFYCEGFEIEGTPAKKNVGEIAPQSTASFAVAEDSAGLVGLCGDCENRQTCIFPRPEGGIWHCEEYQ